MQSKAAEVIQRCRQLAQITDVAGETTRLFLSNATKEAHRLLTRWMCAAGLQVRTDDIGNLRGWRSGPTPTSPTLLLFSHIDTVPNAGPFDGCLGILASLAVLEAFRGKPLPFAIELIAFSEEEGVRFGWPFLGSRAAVTCVSDADLERKDEAGESVADALAAFGLSARQIGSTCPIPSNTFAAIEIHIEQGPVLEHLDHSIGVVDAIIGQSHLEVTFEGTANHAGTTPMKLRSDALAAAADWIGKVERYASNREPLVATVGCVHAKPNAVNVIPGLVDLMLDVRHRNSRTRHRAIHTFMEMAKVSGTRRGVQFTVFSHTEQPSVAMDAKLTRQLLEASSFAGHQAHVLSSGAGHDAMILAPFIPTALLFVRSPGGLSHHPDETVREQDVQAALETVEAFVESLHPLKTVSSPPLELERGMPNG